MRFKKVDRSGRHIDVEDTHRRMSASLQRMNSQPRDFHSEKPASTREHIVTGWRIRSAGPRLGRRPKLRKITTADRENRTPKAQCKRFHITDRQGGGNAETMRHTHVHTRPEKMKEANLETRTPYSLCSFENIASWQEEPHREAAHMCKSALWGRQTKHSAHGSCLFKYITPASFAAPFYERSP